MTISGATTTTRSRSRSRSRSSSSSICHRGLTWRRNQEGREEEAMEAATSGSRRRVEVEDEGKEEGEREKKG